MLIIFDLIKKYIILILIVFLLSVNFEKNSKKPTFLNLNPKNIFLELQRDVDLFINKKIEYQKLERYGNLLVPYLFERIQNDSSHKNEYLMLYNDLNLDFFKIDESNLYNTDFYIKKYEENKYKFLSSYIEKKLENCYNDKKECETLNIYKELLIPHLMSFIKKNINNVKTKPLIIKLSEIMKVKLPKNDDYLKAWFNFLYLKKVNYYNKNTFLTNIRLVVTETKFYEHLLGSLTLNFGVYNNKSLFEEIKTLFLRTLFILIFSILVAYYLNIYVGTRVFLFKSLFSKFNFLKLIPSIAIIFISAKLFNTNDYKPIIFIVTFIVVTSLILNNELNLFYDRIIKNNKLIKMKLYGLSENIILKHYVIKSVRITYLKRITKLIPVLCIYLLIQEYLFNFDGLSKNILLAIKKQNYRMTTLSLLALGTIIIITTSILNLLINLNQKK